nr:PREDICTED: neurofilament medium polypeptide-like [Linepithema humile]
MAPRKQAKQPAAETVVAAADGNTTPPKKRKIAAKSVAEKPKPVKTGSRATAEKPVVDESAISPKKLRSKTKNTVEVPETGRKKARGKPTTKKAGTSKKPAATKSRAKKPQDEAAVENGDKDFEKGDTGKENSAKRSPLRRGKAVEKSDVPAAASKAKSTAKSRKRKNPEDANNAVTEAESAQIVEKDEETEPETVANKKNRSKSKKVETETSDAPKVKSKGNNEKTETKGRKKKGQTVADEKEAIKDKITEKVNFISEALDENGVKDVASSNQSDSSQENDYDKNNMNETESIQNKTYNLDSS